MITAKSVLLRFFAVEVHLWWVLGEQGKHVLEYFVAVHSLMVGAAVGSRYMLVLL